MSLGEEMFGFNAQIVYVHCPEVSTSVAGEG